MVNPKLFFVQQIYSNYVKIAVVKVAGIDVKVNWRLCFGQYVHCFFPAQLVRLPRLWLVSVSVSQKFITLAAQSVNKGEMMKKIHKENRRRTMCTAALFCFAMATLLSCQKKMDLEGGHLTGVFHGQDCAGTPAPNVVVRENADSKTFLIAVTPFGLNCATNTDLTGTLKGGDVVAFEKQYYTDKCGNKITAFGTGHLSGHAFQYYIKFIREATSGKQDSIVKCFGGVK